MKKKTYPLIYAGKKQQFARSVAVGDLVFLSGSSGRTMETGEVSSDNVADQMKVALDKIRAAGFIKVTADRNTVPFYAECEASPAPNPEGHQTYLELRDKVASVRVKAFKPKRKSKG